MDPSLEDLCLDIMAFVFLVNTLGLLLPMNQQRRVTFLVGGNTSTAGNTKLLVLMALCDRAE